MHARDHGGTINVTRNGAMDGQMATPVSRARSHLSEIRWQHRLSLLKHLMPDDAAVFSQSCR